MKLDIVLDKSSDVPIYRQITRLLKEKIESGEMKSGDRLPTEREISSAVGISRGTVKKAYEELTRIGMLEAVQGRGTFITWSKEVEKEDVCQHMRGSIDHMKGLGFSYDEMKALLNVLLEKEHNADVVNIASIDCNPETLEVFASQISANHNVKFYPFLLDKVRVFLNGADIFKNFDLVFTTTTHFEEINSLLEGQSTKIIKAAVSPDITTIIGLTGLKPGMDIGILTRSQRFAQIIRNNINKTIGFEQEPKYFLLSNTVQTKELAKFLSETQVLIMPPFYTFQLSWRQEDTLLSYCANGGQIITFYYAIERGSLIHISDRISYITKGRMQDEQ